MAVWAKVKPLYYCVYSLLFITDFTSITKITIGFCHFRARTLNIERRMNSIFPFKRTLRYPHTYTCTHPCTHTHSYTDALLVRCEVRHAAIIHLTENGWETDMEREMGGKPRKTNGRTGFSGTWTTTTGRVPVGVHTLSPTHTDIKTHTHKQTHTLSQTHTYTQCPHSSYICGAGTAWVLSVQHTETL